MKKILVVDDNQDITDMAKEMLEFYGYSCTAANSGRSCLNILRSEAFDLILLDVAMPEVTGVDVLKTVKGDSNLKQTRIVFCTASSVTDGEMKKLVEEGALDCIRKPISKDGLLRVVQRYA